MTRPRIIFLALGVLVASAAPALGQADAKTKVYEDALVLLDPHAASADKFDACVRLRKGGDDGAWAIPALARQSHYDQPHIRQLAMETLNLLVGEREAALLRKTTADVEPAQARAALRSWIRSLELWADFRIAPLRRHDILAAALLLWNKSHGVVVEEGFPNLDRNRKIPLLVAMEIRYPTYEVERRKLAIQLEAAINLDEPISTTMALLGLMDEDSEIRALVQTRSDRLFAPGTHNQMIISDLVRMVTKQNPNPWLVTVTNRCLESMGPAARSLAIDLTLARLVEGSSEALFALVAWSGLDTPLAKAVISLGELPPSHRVELARFLRDLALNSGDDLQAQAVQLLCVDDLSLRERGASLIGAAGDRVDRYAALIASVGRGWRQSPPALKRLNLDPAVINPQIVKLLASKEVLVRRAACSVLKVTGFAGEGVRPAVEALLNDLDDDVCISAAELLGRNDILTWMRIPPLLKELRNDDLTRRMIAARQLEDLGVEPKEITSALLRAVDRRDMAVREGLINALESAHAKRRKTLEMLAQTAAQQDDLTTRAYARAALREIAAER